MTREIEMVSSVQRTFLGLVLFVACAAASAQPSVGNALTGVEYITLPGDRVQVALIFANPLAQPPQSFTTDDPARIALDFAGVENRLEKRNQTIGIGQARSLSAVEASGRTRVVVNLVSLVQFETRVQDNRLLVILDSAPAAAVAKLRAGPKAKAGQRSLESVDFRRGEQGAGQVIVKLSDASTPVDVREEGGKVLVEFVGTGVPERLERRLDVTDFATPVKSVDTASRGNNVRMTISASGEYEQFAYQADNLFTVEFRPLTKEEKKSLQKEKFAYTGERLSLNFQDIEVRSVLQLIADFTGLNLVTSDRVAGKLTLRLNNVPWDQALDIILRTKGLAMRQAGNVMLVAPAGEIAAQEKEELESKKQITELAPLRTEFIQINYAKASEIAALLKSEKNSLVSARGSVTIDDRTNTLLVQDTAEKLQELRRVIATLDIPVRQVLIESRVVIASDDFAKDLGVKFGLSRAATIDDRNIWVGGKLTGDTAFSSPTAFFTGDPTAAVENMLVSLPVAGPAASLGLAVGKVGSHLLQLELSALQAEGRGEIVSSPRVVTSDKHKARVEQGIEVPYQEASSSGATTTAFKKAVLALEVTPQITPDNRVILDLMVSKDSPDFARALNNVPPVDTRKVNTQVLVDNGETVVLGGVYEQTKTNNSTRVPFFADLPFIGALFRSKSTSDRKAELLIFVTPKILSESLTSVQ